MTCRLQRAWVSHHWARRSYRPTRFSRQTPLGHSKTPFPCLELAEQPLVLLDLPMSRDYFFPLFEDLGVRPKIAHREASLNMVCSMVANGLGYSILNAHSKTQTAQDGKPFVARSFVETLRPLRFGAVWSERQPLGKTATGFLDFCRETVAQWMPDFE